LKKDELNIRKVRIIELESNDYKCTKRSVGWGRSAASIYCPNGELIIFSESGRAILIWIIFHFVCPSAS
jgi:hypothetical protein